MQYDENTELSASLPLELWRLPFKLPELKILNLYLSNIDPEHPEKRDVHFGQGDIERLFNVPYLDHEHLKAHLRNLLARVEISPVTSGETDMYSIALFERATCIPEESGIWSITLECTPLAMRCFFDSEHISHIKSQLQTVCSLTSSYSYALFLYLEQNRFRNSWDEDLEVLRDILGCTSDFYKSYPQFNQHILQRSHTELLEKTGCEFSYTLIHTDRQVQKIHFHIAYPDSELQKSKQVLTVSVEEEYIEFLRTACCNNKTGEPEFSHFEMKCVLKLLRQLPVAVLSQRDSGEYGRFALHHYLADRYACLNQDAETKPILDRLTYLIEIIKKDIPNSEAESR